MTEQKEPFPQSAALAEASPASLTDLLAKDPFKFTSQDRGQIVAALREQRKKWEAAEAAGASKPKSAPKVAGKAASLITRQSADDLGL